MKTRRLSVGLLSVVLAAAWMVFAPGPALAASCPHVSDAYSRAVLTDSPIAYYRLDETSGPTMCDSSAHANNGTYNSSGITYGVHGALPQSTDTAIEADGTPTEVGQSGSDPAGLTGNHAFTLEVWFKNTEAGPPYTNAGLLGIGETGGSGQIALLSLYPNHNSQLGRGPNSCFGVDQNGADYCWDPTTLPQPINLWDGNWHYLAATYEPNGSPQFTGYVDGHDLGAPVADQYGNPTPNIAASPIYLGGPGSSSGYDKPLNGGLDDAAVYPTALSPQRILAHYVAAVVKPLPTPHGTKISKAKIKKHKATFRFTASGTVTGFLCALIKKKKHHKTPKPKFSACSSPTTYTHLKRDKYTFEVVAFNSGGFATPVIKNFKIK